ncbi:MAG: hypothetical protein H0T53_06615 [Herpetosiphonaceae bacterium]|nr:hypothetical protein [Herpetosiphonaceae bacterium]
MNNDDLTQQWRARILSLHASIIDSIDQRPDSQELPTFEVVALALELALDTLDGDLLRANEVLKALSHSLLPNHALAA